MKTLAALILIATLTSVSVAQIPPAPGMPPVAQAQQAFAFAQAQSMMITNQAQLQGMIAAQATVLTSFQARSMFLTQAASLQVRAIANHGAMFSTQAASIASMQHSLALQNSFWRSRQSLVCAVVESRAPPRCREQCYSLRWTPPVLPAQHNAPCRGCSGVGR